MRLNDTSDANLLAMISTEEQAEAAVQATPVLQAEGLNGKSLWRYLEAVRKGVVKILGRPVSADPSTSSAAEPRASESGYHEVSVDIKKITPPGMESIADELIAIGATIEQAAQTFVIRLKAERNIKREAELAIKLRRLAFSGTATHGDLSTRPDEQRWKAEWNRDPKLREEFPKFECYKGFKANESRTTIVGRAVNA